MNDLQSRFEKILASPPLNPLLAGWITVYAKDGCGPARNYWDALGTVRRLELWDAMDTVRRRELWYSLDTNHRRELWAALDIDQRRRELWDALGDAGKEALLKLVEEK
jgi:hypothetical protein